MSWSIYGNCCRRKCGSSGRSKSWTCGVTTYRKLCDFFVLSQSISGIYRIHIELFHGGASDLSELIWSKRSVEVDIVSMELEVCAPSGSEITSVDERITEIYVGGRRGKDLPLSIRTVDIYMYGERESCALKKILILISRPPLESAGCRRAIVCSIYYSSSLRVSQEPVGSLRSRRSRYDDTLCTIIVWAESWIGE